MYTKSNQRPTEVIRRNTAFYSIYTLIDVTDSDVSSPKINAKKFHQSQNLNTFMQVIGLRTQPRISSVTKLQSQTMADYDFGNNFTGSHTVWLLKFVSETEGAWKKEENETTLLLDDFIRRIPREVCIQHLFQICVVSKTLCLSVKHCVLP